MNCEHVKELLSIYLDNELAAEDRQSVACHLRFCTDCSTLLAEFRRFDALLSRLPRIEPRRSLEARIFSSTEYKELNGTWGGYYYRGGALSPSSRRLRDDPARPKLVSLPGGRLAQQSERYNVSVLPRRRRLLSTVLRVVRIAITVSVLLILGVSCVVGWHLWQKQPSAINTLPMRAPAKNLSQGSLPTGAVFLRDGSLWNTPGERATGMRRPASLCFTALLRNRPALAGACAHYTPGYDALQHEPVRWTQIP